MKVNDRKSYLAKNTFIFALGNFGTKIINFFLVPLYTNILSTAEYGSVDLISTISMVLAPILILNVSESLLRFPLDDDSDNNAIMSTGITTLLIGIVIGLLIIPISKMFSSISNLGLYLYLYTVSYAFFQVFSSYLRGTERLLKYSIVNILNSFLIACLNIIFLCFLDKGIHGYLLAYIFSFFISGIVAFFCGKAYEIFGRFNFNKKLTKNMLKYSAFLIPNTFMWWIINSSDRIMVTSIEGVSANGIYAVSYKLPTLLSTIAIIFNQAWSYSAIKEEKSKDKNEFNNQTFKYLLCGLTLIALFMLLIIKPFLKIYVEDSFYSAWNYTPYLIIGFVFSSLGSFLATSYTVHKDSKGFLFSALTGAIINIILNFVLIPYIGIHGAAIATLISYISVMIYRIVDTKKYIKIYFFELRYLIALILLIASAVSLFTTTLLNIIISSICIIICIIVFRKEYLLLFKNIILMLKEKILKNKSGEK